MSTGTTIRRDIGIFDGLRWGSHLCHLCGSDDELIDLMVPYFRKGLESNALCLWLSSEPLGQQMMEALRDWIPHFDQYCKQGRIVAVPYTEWYLRDGRLDLPTALKHASDALAQAKALCLDGIWVAGEMSWVNQRERGTLAKYEETISQFVSSVPAVALCIHPIKALGIPDALDLFRVHQSIVMQRDGRWEVMESLEHLKSEKALRETERSYQHLFDTTLDGIEVVDAATGRILIANQAAAGMFGFASPEEMVGLDPLAYIPDSDRERVAQMMAENMFEKDLHQVMKLKALKKDGSEIWVSAVGVRTEYQGRLAGLISMRDVTEQRKAENELQESRRNLQAVFDSVRDGIAVFDMTGRLLGVNKRVLEVGGYSIDEIVGRSFHEFDMFGSQDIAKMASVFTPILSGLEAPPLELEVTTKFGQKLVLEVRVSPLKRDGDVVGSIAVVRDITERKRAVELLQVSELRNRLLVENSSEGILVVQQGSVQYTNRRCLEIIDCLGYTVEELKARPLEDFVHPEDRLAFLDAREKRLAGQKPDVIRQFRAVGKTGQIRWIELNAVRLTWDGKPALLIFLNDVTERRDAEETLKRREQEFRALAENASDVVARFDREKRHLYINRAVERLVGIPREEFIGKTNGELGAPEELVRFWEEAAVRVFHTGMEKVIEYKMPTVHGHGHFEAHLTPEFAPDGSVESVLAVSRDITDRKHAEEALRESELRYRLIAENSSDVIWTMDMNLRITYISPSCEKLTGYTVQESMVATLKEGLMPASYQAAAKAYMEGLAELERNDGRPGLPITLELEFKRKDGSTVWGEVTVSFMQDSGGSVVGIMGVARDIDERRRARQALVDSEQRYRLLAENVSDVIWVTDVDLHPTYVSPSIERLLGYRAGESLSRGLEEALSSLSADKVRGIAARLKAAGRDGELDGELEHPVEIELRRKDGSNVWVDTTATVIRDTEGHPVQFLGVLRDVTEKKQAEEQVKQTVKKLERTLEGTIQAIRTMVDSRDRYTAGHQQRVTELSCAIAEAMGLPSKQIESIHIAGLLHDIGKIVLPTEILTKPGRLNEIEFAMIRSHSKVGHDILKSVEFPWPIAKMVLQHHERVNGTGYPDGIRGEETLLEARILAVADVVEAMSSHRPYRPALGLDKALDEIVGNRGVLYDPQVVDACVRVFKENGFSFKGEAVADLY